MRKTGDEPEEEGATWLLLYDFKGVKPGIKFWINLNRLAAKGTETSLVQYSALLTHSRRVAKAAKRLAEHYGAKVEVFKGPKEG
jgi:hypothetical protein